MAQIFKFKNREGVTPMTDEELLLIAAFRDAPRDMQQRMLALAMKPKKPEPGRS